MITCRSAAAAALAAVVAAACSSPTSTTNSASASPASASPAYTPPSASTLAPAAAPHFDDVPPLLTSGRDAAPSVLLTHRAELPAAVTQLTHAQVVSPEGLEPGLSRASLAVGFLCGGPQLSRVAVRAGESRHGVAAVVAVLRDPHLRDWLACGRRAAILSRWSYDEVTAAFTPSGDAATDAPSTATDRRAGAARFFATTESVASIAPPHFVAPASALPGLSELRCEHVEGGVCLPASTAVARVAGWDLVGIGDARTLAAIGGRRAPYWGASTATVSDADTRGVDFVLAAPADPMFGFLDFAVQEPAFTARDALETLVRAERAVTFATIDSNHEGPGLLVLAASTRGGGAKLDAAVTSLRAAIAKGKIEPRGPDARADEIQGGVLTRMSLEASARATQRVDGEAVRVEGTLAVAPEDRAPVDGAARAKSGLQTIWARVLTTVLGGDLPSRDDLRALYGAGEGPEIFAGAILLALEHAPEAAKERAPLRTHPTVELPTYATYARDEKTEGATAVVTYAGGSTLSALEILDTLRAQGFSVSVSALRATFFELKLHRGGELFELSLRPSGGDLQLRLSPL